MKKWVSLLTMMMGFSAIVSAQNETAVAGQPMLGQPDSDKGFFLFTGFLYSYEKIDPNPMPDPQFENSGLSALIGLGYDFGRITLSFPFDYMLLSEVKYYGLSSDGGSQIKDAMNLGVGLNIGIKIINGTVFDLTVPIGALLRLSSFTIKHGSVYNGYTQYIIEDSKFLYLYLNIESGLLLSWSLAKGFMILVPFNIGYPLYKDSTVTGYEKKDFAPFNFLVGLGVRRTF